MSTLTKRIIVALLISAVSITMASLAIKSCIIKQQKKEVEQVKKQVNENFKKPYAKSDSAVGATKPEDIGAKYSEVEQRRFGK